MTIEFNFIAGIMFGVEYVDADEEERHIVLDLGFLRLLFTWDAE